MLLNSPLFNNGRTIHSCMYIALQLKIYVRFKPKNRIFFKKKKINSLIHNLIMHRTHYRKDIQSLFGVCKCVVTHIF
jgi:hypothetical protein